FWRAATPRAGSSLDHLIGAPEDQLRDRQTERLSGFQIDDQLEFGWLLDWQVGRLGPFEDLIDIGRSAPVKVSPIGSEAHQAAKILAILSHSGGLCVGLVTDTRRFGFSHIVSSGNEATVSAA